MRHRSVVGGCFRQLAFTSRPTDGSVAIRLGVSGFDLGPCFPRLRGLGSSRMVVADASLISTSHYYDSCAAEYAAFADGHSSDQLIGSLVAKLNPRSVVADLGCGSGRDLAFIESLGFKGLGIDLSPGLLAQALFRTSLPLAQADVRSLPLKSSSLDGVTAVASLHHVPTADQTVVIGEIARVLKPGGMGILTAKLSKRRSDEVHPRSACVRTFYRVDPGHLTSAMERTGLAVVKCEVSPDDRGRATPWIQLSFVKGR